MNAKLNCKVVAIKTPKPDMSFAHIQLGEIWADVPCESSTALGEAKLVITFKDFQGRLQVSMRVHPA